MLLMVIERDLTGPGPVGERPAARGRLLPEGLRSVDSWVVDDDHLDRSVQLMETDDPTPFDVWCARWRDLVASEVHPVIASAAAARRAAG
jgi:hypothetical protein